VCGNHVSIPRRFYSTGSVLLPTVPIDVTTEARKSKSGIPYVVALLNLGQELCDGFNNLCLKFGFMFTEFGHYNSPLFSPKLRRTAS
jgi:hypothetical protein